MTTRCATNVPVHRFRSLLVIGLTSLLVLSACQSTATVELTNAAPTSTSAADPGSSSATTDPTDSVEAADPTDPAPAATDSPGDPSASFELRGELPMSTDEVNELISFIEDQTGRPFLRPPVIVAQTPEAFTAALEDDLADFQDDAEVDVRTLQALGLTTDGVAEVTQAFETLLLSPEGILGYYDPDIDELFVPVGAEADNAFRALLVHELTHALDGQYADLTVLEDLFDEADETGNYEPIVALRSVVEGRASAVENAWRSENNAPQEISDDLGAAADVPIAMLLELGLPYALGEQYIQANGGPAETWDLLDAPPASSEEVVAIGLGDASGELITQVATPNADGPILNEQTYGAFDLLVWLMGDSLEPDPGQLFTAFSATDGWAGGRSVLWGDANESCIRISFAADSTGDLVGIWEAISLWANDGPDRSVELQGDLVVATGCAPYVP